MAYRPTTGSKAIAHGQGFVLSVGTRAQFGSVTAEVEPDVTQQMAPASQLRYNPGAVAGLSRCCDVCGRPLALTAWLTGQRTCDPCQEYNAALDACLQAWPVSQQSIVALDQRASQLGLLPADRLQLHEHAFVQVCAQAVDNGVVSQADLQHLQALASWLQLPAAAISSPLGRLQYLAQIQRGPLPTTTSPPLRMLPGEVCHWMENQCRYIEQQTHTERVGGYSGYSMRVYKGLTYRVGSLKGRSYPVTESVCADTGCFIITSSRVAFVGPRRSLAIPYKKILSMQVYSNGVQLQTDGARARPQMFTLGDVHPACIILTRAMDAAL
jgi:hypothetical protein